MRAQLHHKAVLLCRRRRRLPNRGAASKRACFCLILVGPFGGGAKGPRGARPPFLWWRIQAFEQLRKHDLLTNARRNLVLRPPQLVPQPRQAKKIGVRKSLGGHCDKQSLRKGQCAPQTWSYVPQTSSCAPPFLSGRCQMPSMCTKLQPTPVNSGEE